MRYDVELTDTIPPIPFRDPLTGISLSAADFQALQDGLNVQQGFPRDTNNIAPRFGLAWDIKGDGKTVLRAAFGLFYDHPLLAVAFNSDIADASQQQQYTNVLPISPAPECDFESAEYFPGNGLHCGDHESFLSGGRDHAGCGSYCSVPARPSGFQRSDIRWVRTGFSVYAERCQRFSVCLRQSGQPFH